MVNPRLVTHVCLCCLLTSPAGMATSVDTEPPSFTAHFRHWHEPSNTVLDEARITYSLHGLRVEQQGEAAGNVFIANYSEDAFWFVDRNRHLVHAIPVIVGADTEAGEVAATEMSGMSAEVLPGDRQDSALSIPRRFSAIQFEPCEGLSRVSLGELRFQGRAVQRWSCLFGGEEIEEHWFSDDAGVVVRTETPDGFVSELTDVQSRRFVASTSFRPPSHYRSVEIQELINSAVPISSYREEENGQP